MIWSVADDGGTMRRTSRTVNGAVTGCLFLRATTGFMGHHEVAANETGNTEEACPADGASRLKSLVRLLDSLAELPDASTAAAAACALLAAELTDAGISLLLQHAGAGQKPDLVLADYPSGIGLTDISRAETIAVPVDFALEHSSEMRVASLVAWRSRGDRRFNASESWLLANVAAGFLPFMPRLVAAHGNARPSMIDPETESWSLPNLLEQTGRRFDRLDIEERVGTMLALGWVRCDGTTAAEASSVIVRESVVCLRDMLRPIDLIGRVGPTRLAVWCDGVDHLIAAERADRIVARLEAMLVGSDRHVAIGIASRWPRSGDDPALVLERARAGLEQARLAATATRRPAVRIWQGGGG